MTERKTKFSSLLLNLYSKISNNRKFQIPLLGLLMLIGIFAEVASLGLVIPFLGILTSPDDVLKYEIVYFFYTYFGYENPSDLIFPITIIFLSFVAAANLIRLILYWATTKFVYGIGHEVATKVFSNTVFQPYEYHLYTNSSEIIGAVNKAQIIVGNVLLPLIRMIISLFIIIAISITLLVINPKVFYLALISIGFSYLVISFFTKTLLKSNSSIIAKNQSLRVKELQEALGGIREIILDSSYHYYISRFSKIEYDLRSSQAKNLVIGEFPRYIMETIGIVGISVFAFFAVSSSSGFNNIIPLLGALALGAQKLLPLIQQVYSGWANINGNLMVLKDVVNLVNTKAKPRSKMLSEKIDFNSEISLRNIYFKYQNSKKTILKDIDFSIKKGEKVGIIGKTGSGKSTLADLIMSFLQPSEGKFFVDDVEINSSNKNVWQSMVANVPQSIFLIDGTILENITLNRDLPIDKTLEKVCKQARLSDFINSLPNGLETSIGERGIRLSGGQIQRIGIARALYKNPSILILDEATSSLDNVTEKEIIESIDCLDDQLTIITIAHRLTTLSFCNKIVQMDQGIVAKIGHYEDIVLKNKLS